jgi:hypothetical protein
MRFNEKEARMTDHYHRGKVAIVTGACGCYLVDGTSQ